MVPIRSLRFPAALAAIMLTLAGPVGAALSAARLAQDVRQFVDELQIPAIYVTHDVGEAMTLADYAVTLSGGRVVASGEPLHVLPHNGAD